MFYIFISLSDSLCISVPNVSKKHFFDSLSDEMDFSNYPEDHYRYSRRIASVPGYFKVSDLA